MRFYDNSDSCTVSTADICDIFSSVIKKKNNLTKTNYNRKIETRNNISKSTNNKKKIKVIHEFDDKD